MSSFIRKIRDIPMDFKDVGHSDLDGKGSEIVCLRKNNGLFSRVNFPFFLQSVIIHKKAQMLNFLVDRPNLVRECVP